MVKVSGVIPEIGLSHLYDEGVELFYSDLCIGLDNLERLLGPADFITFDWLVQAVDFLKLIHSKLIPLVEKLLLCVSLRGEEWLNAYMDETVKLLDVCNVLQAGISGLEHYNALVEIVVRELNETGRLGQGQGNLGLHALVACRNEVQRIHIENNNLVETKILADRKLYCNLDEKHVENMFVKWNGFWGVMFAVKIVTSYLSWLLLWALASGRNIFSLKMETIAFKSPWSGAFLRLQQRADEAIHYKIREADDVPNMVLHEFGSLQTILADLRRQLQAINWRQPLAAEESLKLRQGVQQLRHLSFTFREQLETLDWRVNDFFDEIVEGRKQILEIFQGSSSS